MIGGPRSTILVSALLLLAMSTGAVGCKKKELKRYNWVGDELGGPDSPLKCKMRLVGTALGLDFDPVPAGTTITVNGKTHTPTGKLHIDIDIGEKLGALKTTDVLSPSFTFNPQIPMVLSTPTGGYKTEIPPLQFLTIGLKSGAGKPIKFGAEPPAPAGGVPDVLYLGLNDEAIGSPATLRDIEWIAAQGPDTKSVAGPICKYQDRATGALSSAPLTILAPEVLIYDRRTAAVIDRKVFFATPSCPLTKQAADKTVATLPSDATITAWIKERRTKK